MKFACARQSLMIPQADEIEESLMTIILSWTKIYMLQVKFDLRLNFFNLGWFSIGHLNLAGITKFKYHQNPFRFSFHS